MVVSSGKSGSTGKVDFADKIGANTPQRQAQINDVLEQIKAAGLESLRISFADQHGILRGKTLVISETQSAMQNGCTMTTSLLAKDTSHKTIFAMWEKGAGNAWHFSNLCFASLMLPDPTTFRILPWATKTGWMLCDIYFNNGDPIPFSTRQLLRNATEELAQRNMQLICGLEVEFHVFKLDDPKLSPADAGAIGSPAAAHDVSLLAHGYQYLTEQRTDEIEPVSEMLRKTCAALNLPLRSMETEFGPSQFEFTFQPTDALTAADNMMLFRSAVKQVCHRNGLHATFMSKPQVENTFASGWHLHQSLVDTQTGENLLIPSSADETLSQTGLNFVGGLLKHASDAVIFACPTINAYKRFLPYTLAPDRIVWGRDNKGAMLRIISAMNDPASRIENRVGEPAANPYLYFMSQIWAGLDGIDKNLDPGAPIETPYDCQAERLPTNLMIAGENLSSSELFRERLGDQFVDYYLTIKRAEIDRFMQTVTDWEQREYFEIF